MHHRLTVHDHDVVRSGVRQQWCVARVFTSPTAFDSTMQCLGSDGRVVARPYRTGEAVLDSLVERYCSTYIPESVPCIAAQSGRWNPMSARSWSLFSCLVIMRELPLRSSLLP